MKDTKAISANVDRALVKNLFMMGLIQEAK
jgi:hypothetical protein